MSTERKENENIRWLLMRIQEASEATGSDEIEYDLDEFSKSQGTPPVSIQRNIIFWLREERAIEVIEKFFDTGNLAKLKSISGGGYAIKPIGFNLKILQPRFYELCKEFASKEESVPILSSEFDFNKALLKISGKNVGLPEYRNEHYFCQIMFEYPVGEAVDWLLIYPRMFNGQEPNNISKNMRTVRDTMYAINKRVREVAKIERVIYSWENKNVKRNF